MGSHLQAAVRRNHIQTWQAGGLTYAPRYLEGRRCRPVLSAKQKSPKPVKMARRSAGFVSKKPHRKSRGGCLTCKRKKVKVRPAAKVNDTACNNPISVMNPCLPVDTALYGSWIAITLRMRLQNHLHRAMMPRTARSHHLLWLSHHPRTLTSTTPLVKSQAGSFRPSI
jgi:hypothetical protein